MRRFLALTLVAVLGLSVIVFASGTKADPYRLILVPSTDVAVVADTGDQIAAALTQITGLEIQAFMTPDIPAAISEYSTASGDVFGFLSTAAYLDAVVETYDVTGEYCDFPLISVRNGYIGYWTGYYVRRDSGIETFADLDGKTWGFPYPGSTSGFKVPNVELQNAGITVGGTLETGSHNASLVALYNGDVDFITSFFSPPQAPIVLRQLGLKWEPGMDLELGIWNSSPADTHGETEGLITGDLAWYVKDVRESFLLDGTYPDVVEKITLVSLSSVIPNDGVSFVPGFPAADKAAIVAAIKSFIVTPAGNALFSNPSFYAWDNVQDTTDAIYDVYRQAKGYEVPNR
ncbi:PhnD/SsuA/transferrin family substrate-binding protein [Candidatus Bipolaricaulota bacterium]